MMGRRRGRPGLIGTAARTAVIAGTATATANAVNRRSMEREQQAADADAYQQQQQYAAQEDAQQAAPPPAVAPAEDSLVSKIERLAALHTAGALTDDEFAAAKANLLS